MAEEDWNLFKKPEYITNLDRMPIHHKILSHQRQRVNRANTSRQVQKSSEKFPKHQHRDRRATRSSIANSDLWLDFNVDAPIEESDEEEETIAKTVETSELIYTNSCKKFGVTPREMVIKHLATERLSISDGRLRRNDIQPITYSLTMNSVVTILDISGNNIGSDSFKQFIRMLEENVSITELDVSYNELRSEGAKLLGQLLCSKNNLLSLKASGNEFENDDASYFSEGLKQNYSLLKLNLSNNNFQEQGGIKLANALDCNSSIENLDLSWNQLRLSGAVALGNSLQKNETLKHVNLSWNGFSDIGCETIGKSLLSNSCLETLDLSSNRICYEGCKYLARSLVINQTLYCLKVNFNSISTRGALELLIAIRDNHNSSLSRLELQEIPVIQSCLEIVEDIKKTRGNFQVIHDVKVLSEDFFVRCVKPKSRK